MKLLVVFMLACVFYQANATGHGETKMCPTVIKYNMTFWQDHFNMKFIKPTGLFWDVPYTSEEMTTDLPPTFPAGADRPFAAHAYLLMGPSEKMWLVRYPADQVLHWYQGESARLYVFHPETLEMEKRILNARNVVTVIEANYWLAADLRSIGDEKYVLFGCTIVPAVYDEDRQLAKKGQLVADNKQAQRIITRFTSPNE